MQLLSVPPYACAAVLTVLIGYIGDRTRQRGLCNICISVLGIAGFVVLLCTKSAGSQYAGVFLGAMGIYPCIANTISWTSNNIEGEIYDFGILLHSNSKLSLFIVIGPLTRYDLGVYKRGITLGIVIGWGNLNGIVSSNIYRGSDAPRFYPGHGTVLAYLTLFLFGGSIMQYILLRRENRKRQHGDRDHWTEGLTPLQVQERGDMRPDFLYTL